MSVSGESKISGEPMAGTKRYRSSIIALSVLLALLISAIAITVIILGLRRKRSGYRFTFGSLFHTPLILARLFSRIKIAPSDAGDLAIIRSQSSVLRDTDSNHPHNAEPDAGQTLIPGRQSAHLKDRVTDLEMALRDAREHFEDATTDIQRMHVEIRRLTVQLASERRDVLPPRYSAGD
ncbi:hypothetical protein C8J56DRAFT_114032 [Mycena floridula]|nr:hypothetical protein C8J56DRAFT_114032 [Mycena floridula]